VIIPGRLFCLVPAWTPPALQRGLAHCFGDDADAAWGAGVPNQSILLLTAEDLPQLAVALRQPVQAVIELPAAGGADSPDQEVAGEWLAVPRAPRAAEGSLFLSLTTASAYRLPCATLVCDALEQRGLLSEGQRSGTELALQEAIANALIHGNLGLDSSQRQRGAEIATFGRLVRERLAEPQRGQRRLRLLVCWGGGRLELTVSDQGCGFAPECLDGLPGGRAHFGRGFLLMRAVAAQVQIADGGRCTALRFEL